MHDVWPMHTLHLAAIAPDESLAEKLLKACKCSAAAWFTASAADGLTPAHFAARLSRHGQNTRLLLLAQSEEVQASCSMHVLSNLGQRVVEPASFTLLLCRLV